MHNTEKLAEASRKATAAKARLKEIEKTLPTPTQAYIRLAGEAESRTTSKRHNLTLEERRNSLFTDDMYKDVAKEDLIFYRKV